MASRGLDAALKDTIVHGGAVKVTLTVGGRDYTRMVEVEEDRWLTER
jgi:hypothetical protein